MAKAVKKFVDACLVCKACKGNSGARQLQLHPIPKVATPWHTVHIDLSGKSSKREYVCVIIDAFTKYVMLRLTASLDANCAVESLKEVINLFSTPKRVIADQGRCFISSQFKQFCSDNNIELHVIAVGASRANGQVERVMQTLKNLLTITENNSDTVWRNELGEIQLVLNSTKCRVTGYSPMELMFGIKSQPLGISKITCADEIIAKSDTVRFNRGKAKIKPFRMGDFVILKCCERNQTKLDRKFRGPFKIIRVLENDHYELQHVNGSKRKYKYPHESLRRVPNGQEVLIEVAEAFCDGALEQDELVSAVSNEEINDRAREYSSDNEINDVVVGTTVAEVHRAAED